VVEPAEPVEDVLERRDAVSETRRLLIAEAFAEVGEPLPKAGQPVFGLLGLFRRRPSGAGG
jgi:hypothetical protein